MANPYNITQFSAAEAVGMYEAGQNRRMQQLLYERKIAADDREIEQKNKTAAAWAKIFQPKGGDPSSMSGAYGAPASPVAGQTDATAPSVAPSGVAPPVAAPAGGMGIDPNAARELAGALGPERGLQFLQQWETLNKAQREAVAAQNEDIGQAIVWADTPEKWDQAVDFLSRTNPALAKYKGRFDQRPQAAMEIGAMKTFVDGSKSAEAYTLNPGATRFGPDNRIIARSPFKPETIRVGEGERVIEYTPGGEDGGQGGGASPRGIRNNNAGNIEDGPYARSLPGYAGSDGRFAKFDTPEAGDAARTNLLGNYIERGFNTPAEIIGRWSPASENGEAGTNNYINFVAKKLGIDPNDPVTPAQIPQLAAAIAQFENGGSSPSSGPAGPRVVAEGPPKSTKPRWRTLPPEEAKARGYPTAGGAIYQEGPDGQIQPISGTATKQGRAVSETTQRNVGEQVDIYAALDRAVGGFNDDFAGNTWTGGLENTMQGMFDTGTPGQRAWWADFRQTDNLIRNKMFGSALTDTEKKAYEATTISERMTPKIVRENLEKRRGVIAKALARRARVLKANGYNEEAVSALFGDDPAILEQAARRSGSGGWGKAEVIK